MLPQSLVDETFAAGNMALRAAELLSQSDMLSVEGDADVISCLESAASLFRSALSLVSTATTIEAAKPHLGNTDDVVVKEWRFGHDDDLH